MRFITTRRRLDTPPRTIINYLSREWVYEIFRGAATDVYKYIVYSRNLEN